MKKKKVSFITVFLNEEKNLENTFHQVRKIEALMPEVDYEVIFVNDGSTDGSWQVVKNLASQYSFVKAVSFTRNFGAISAVMAGLAEVEGDYIVDMAADGQEPIELFVELIKSNVDNHYEISWAVRRTRQDSIFSKIFGKMYYTIMRSYAIPNFPKEGLDAFCISKRLGDFLLDNYTATSNMHNLLYWANFESGKVYYDRQERKHGKSKWSLKKKLNLFINSFISFSYFPLRLVSILGITMMSLSVIWGTYIILHGIFTGFPVQGYASILAMLLFGFGITNFSIGIISEYIWRTLDNVKPKPLYIVKEKINTKNGN